jgi:curved DNA-binding protein CbpA
MHTAHLDPKGYFAALGLAPDADAAAIKAAFHAHAKRLHPDINAAPGAETAFQRVSEAYRVLRDPLQRLSYEAFGEGIPVATAIRPHACGACGRVSAQPRFVAFKLVKSCLVATRQREEVGIFCPSCARAAALKASLSTWLMGWWAPLGPVLAFHALLVNLLGGVKPRPQNFNMLLHQARAFAARGETEVASALALQARAFATDTHDRERLLEATRGLGEGGRRLRDAWGVLNGAFLLQMLPLLALAIAAATAAAMLPDLPEGRQAVLALRRLVAGWVAES